MGSPLFHVGATAMCPHGGQISTVPASPRVLVGGQPVATLGDQFLIAGCSFTIPPSKPSPCLKVQWLVPATRVRVGGQPALLKTSSALCQSPEQAPQGPPNIVVTQMRVTGT